MTIGKRVPRWRKPFLRALAATGNVRLSASRAGIHVGAAYDARKRHPEFAGQWDEALEAFCGAREGESQELGGPPGPELVLRQSKRCGPQWVKAGKGRWNVKAEKVFLAALATTGNIRQAARAAGFSATAVHARMNRYPAFAEGCRAAIDRARADLDSLVLGTGIATFDPEGAEGDPSERPKMSVSEAIAYLRLTPSRKGARGGRTPIPEEPSIEEVQEEVLRRLAAIRRQRDEGRGDG